MRSQLLYTSSKMWPYAANIVNHPYHFDQEGPKHTNGSLQPLSLPLPKVITHLFKRFRNALSCSSTSFAIQLNK